MEEIDLKELFSMFWEKKYLILILVFFFAVIGWAYTEFFVVPEYESSTTLVLVSGNTSSTSSTNTITSSDITLNSNLVATYSQIIESNSVLEKVIENLNLKDIDIETLKNKITVSEVEDAEVIKITVANEDAEVAYKIANETAVVFIEKAEELYNISNIRVLDVAKKAESPANINFGKNIVLFAFIGLVIGIGYIFIINMVNNSVKSAEDIEKITKLPVLATIPIKQEKTRKN